MTTTPIVDAPDWEQAQESPWLEHNEAIRRLEALANKVIEDRDLSAPPGSCSDGDCYLIASSPTGLWAGHTGDIAIAVGANASNGWYFLDPEEGQIYYVRDENIHIQLSGVGWERGMVGQRFELIVAVSDETTAITAGLNKVRFRMPAKVRIYEVRASVNEALESGAPIVIDVRVNGSTMFTTRPSIDPTELTSVTAQVPAVITGGSLTIADDTPIAIDIDDPGDGAIGLKVTFIGCYQP